ncbi:MAG: hypothetical protein ACTHKG_04680 [Nocardioides sp.]
MTAQSTWPPTQPDRPEPMPPPKEILETPQRRWPKTAIAVVALLLGIGLGNAFFDDSSRLDDSLDRLETLTGQLDRANAEVARLRANDTLPDAVTQARAERAALATELDRAVVDGATMFMAGLPGVVDRSPATPAVKDLLATYVAATNDGDVGRLLSTFTHDGVLTLMAPMIAGYRTDFRGTEIGSDFLTRGTYHLRLTSPVAEAGSFVWARYRLSGDEGVLMLRLQGRRIAHAWVVEANPPVGLR